MTTVAPTKNCIVHYGSENTTENLSSTVTPLDKYEPCQETCMKYGNESTTTPKDFASWKVLLDAGECREYQPLLQYKDHTTVPQISYHSQCRKRFIMKRDLVEIKRKKKALNNSETSDCKRKSVRITSPTSMKSTTILSPTCVLVQLL